MTVSARRGGGWRTRCLSQRYSVRGRRKKSAGAPTVGCLRESTAGAADVYGMSARRECSSHGSTRRGLYGAPGTRRAYTLYERKRGGGASGVYSVLRKAGCRAVKGVRRAAWVLRMYAKQRGLCVWARLGASAKKPPHVCAAVLI